MDRTWHNDGTFINEDHFTLISETGTEFLTHITPVGLSNSENVSNAIIENIQEKEDITDIKVYIYIIIKYYIINIIIYIIIICLVNVLLLYWL